MTTGCDGAVAQQVKQNSHVGLELLRVCQSAGSDAVEHRATATVQAAQRAQPERRGSQTFAPDRHGLRPIADE